MDNYVEFYPSPSVLLSNEQTDQLRAQNGLSRKLELPYEQEPVDKQLAKRPGVIRPGSGLTTSQRNIEIMPKPPAILLKDNVSESVSQKPEVRPLNDVNNRVPDPPAILTQPQSTPRIVHNQLCFQNHVHNGGDEKWR